MTGHEEAGHREDTAKAVRDSVQKTQSGKAVCREQSAEGTHAKAEAQSGARKHCRLGDTAVEQRGEPGHKGDRAAGENSRLWV